jgi:hypothetical protein
MVGGVEGDAFGAGLNPGIARCAIKLGEQGTGAERPGQGVFTPARSDEQDIHDEG